MCLWFRLGAKKVAGGKKYTHAGPLRGGGGGVGMEGAGAHHQQQDLVVVVVLGRRAIGTVKRNLWSSGPGWTLSICGRSPSLQIWTLLLQLLQGQVNLWGFRVVDKSHDVFDIMEPCKKNQCNHKRDWPCLRQAIS